MALLLLRHLMANITILGGGPNRSTTQIGKHSISLEWFLPALCCFFSLSTGCISDESSQVDQKTKLASKDDVKMVLIPAGEFLMGDADEGTIHPVYLAPYLIDTYPVTNARYRQFMQATGHHSPLYWNNSQLNQPNHPVVGISWNDANSYAKWAGKRLPTEAEWEKAARGSLVGKKYPWGDEIPDRSRANFGGLEEGTTTVGKYPPNGFNLYDMGGSIFGLCSDKYEWDYYKKSPRENPSGPETGDRCVARGGSYHSTEYYLRCSSRYDIFKYVPSFIDVGFRCAKTPTVSNAPSK